MAHARKRAPIVDDGADPSVAVAVLPNGTFHLDPRAPDAMKVPAPVAARLEAAFAQGLGEGLSHLGSVEIGTVLPPSLAFARELAKLFFTQICRTADLEANRSTLSIPAPLDELSGLVASAPPMLGAEYLSVEGLAAAWSALEAQVQREIDAFPGPVEQYLHGKSPLWNAVGRVHFHLAENKRNEDAPFAFMATYATSLSKLSRVQHAPLGRALEQYAGEANTAMMLALLAPVQRAAEKSQLVRNLVASGELFHPVAWTPKEAFEFIQEIPILDASGVVVRLPDWWRARRPPRPQVRVTLGTTAASSVGINAMLDFHVDLMVDDEPVTPEEWQRILASSSDHLVLLKGKWVEVDRDKLQQVLNHWQGAERQARDGISFLAAMRTLSGVSAAPMDGQGGADATAWTQVKAGPWLDAVLADLRNPHGSRDVDPGDALKGTLRPYQRDGLAWLWLLWKLGLGACLADDMGLGKTIQILGFLLLLAKHGDPGPHLLVVPASLLGNWRAELARFAPSLRPLTLHPSEMAPADLAGAQPRLHGVDVVLTTYGTVLRTPWIARQPWGVVVLDEAQAIKNPDAQQTRAIKAVAARMRVALTGTPVENRLSDLWSIFDFLCPGLLGSAKDFRGTTKRLEASGSGGYAPLRSLLRPYILRRLKSDKRILADLPDKTEVRAFCSLTAPQAALYEKAVGELRGVIDTVEGIQRRGVVLSYLLRFKQICDHPSLWLGDGAYDPAESGKFARLRELCEPIAGRQEKLLVFTQFREMTGPLAGFLSEVFGRAGVVLHGEVPVKKRAGLVAAFQDDSGPPFFVLSLKAGGTGLNLTAASHVVHFDRWWNPAVENQATDRAYRIGQKKNVLVHKFVCRGTIEEKIDELIEAKRGLSNEILSGGGEAWITELSSEDLIRMVSLDLRSAAEER